MSESEHVTKLVEALEGLGYVKVATVTQVSPTQLRLLCRVSDKKAWLEKLERLLLEIKGWKPHVCQQYFLKDDAMVYGWNVVINSEDIPATVTSICRVLTVPVHVEVDSFPLRGAYRPPEGAVFDPRATGPDRGGPSHRGVFPVGGRK